MTRVLMSKEVETVGELIDALKDMADAPLDKTNVLDAIYVYGPTGNHVRVSFIETTLSDGSRVYDITLGERA